MYIDGFNMFLASYHACRELNENCEPVGGYVGFLRQLKNLIVTLSPHKVVVVFDGPNAGFRRKQLFKEYKGKRGGSDKIRELKINIGTDEEKDIVGVNNEQQQFIELFNILKQLPVTLCIVPYCEADDAIAYLVKKNPNYHSLIVSNDKDYLQLVDDNVNVYQFSKKLLITPENFMTNYNIKKENFLFYRTIVGDISDELSGINGIGEKNILKYFPQINTTIYNTIEEFWDAIEKIEEKGKIVEKLKEGKKISYLMYELMRLDESGLSLKSIETINSQLEQQKSKHLAKMTLKIYFIKHHLNLHIKDFETWANSFVFLKNNLELSI